MTLEHRLERLAHRTPEGDPADMLAAARRRAETERRQPRRNNRLLAAAAVVAVLAAGTLVLVTDGDSDDAVTVAGPDKDADTPVPSGAAVSVVVKDLGPLTVSTSGLMPSADGWLEHTVIVTNTGAEPTTFNLLPVGEVLGDKELAVAAEGCRYENSSSNPLDVLCEDWESVTIEPNGEHRFTVTLWRDLQGMNAIAADSLDYEMPVEHWNGPNDTFRSAPGLLTFTYTDLASRSGGDVESSTARALPGWVPDGYHLAWVDTPATPPSDVDRFALHERPHDYAYGYQKAGAAELEVRVMVGAFIDDPETVAAKWNSLAAPMTLGGRPAVGVTDEGRYTRLLVEVDGGVAMITTHPLGESYPDGLNPAMPPREDVDRFAASIAGVSDADWDAALSSSGADAATTFGPKDGTAVVDGDGWSLVHGEFRAPLSVRHQALWVDFGGATGGAAGSGVLGENDVWHVAIAVHDSTRVAWGILPAGAATVEVTIDGQVYTVGTVALADTAERAFAVDVSRSTGNGTFRATGPSGGHVASGPVDIE